MLLVFHPTILVAALDTAIGITLPPHGEIAMIGFPIRLATSISYCIHSLYAAYMPEITNIQLQGAIFLSIAALISAFVCTSVESRF